MNLKPLGDRVIVKPITEEERTKSGIVLPDTAEKERPEQGEVIAVGPGKRMEDGKRAPMEVKKGDRVVFTKYSPNEVEIDDVEYLILKEDDVLAIIEK
ncbi:MAG: co-chaperone GroES [Parcubacteria group bacterium]|nr:co-chaperone GroES [Parcubacteria group bacterium]